MTTKLDSDNKEDIKIELYWSPFVDEDEVEISVDDGIATLTGKVDSWSEWEAAEEDALEGGAIKVVNKLDIEQIAVVGEKKWEKNLTTLFKPFTRAKVNYFDRDQKDEALNWLSEKADASRSSESCCDS